MWRNFRFLHICHDKKFENIPHVEKFHNSSHLSYITSEISPHPIFFLHKHVGGVGDKYQVWCYVMVLVSPCYGVSLCHLLSPPYDVSLCYVTVAWVTQPKHQKGAKDKQLEVRHQQGA